METGLHAWKEFERLTVGDALIAILILLAARVLAEASQRALRHLAESGPARSRLAILRWIPATKLVIVAGATIAIIPILIEPTTTNVMALVASIGLAMAFALKDFGSSLVAALVTVLENTYQPGDWIEIDGTYGEVRQIGLRALHLVTPDDTEVIVPHAKLWTTSVFNASSGNPSLLCTAELYVHPDHDAAALRERLATIASSSAFRKPETSVIVVLFEKPWGTQYKVKCHARESREQFQLISDITMRAKEAIREMGIRYAMATPLVPVTS